MPTETPIKTEAAAYLYDTAFRRLRPATPAEIEKSAKLVAWNRALPEGYDAYDLWTGPDFANECFNVAPHGECFVDLEMDAALAERSALAWGVK